MKIMAAGMEWKFWVGQILGIINLQNLVYGGGEWKEEGDVYSNSKVFGLNG